MRKPIISVRARTTITATAVAAVATISICFLLVSYLDDQLTRELDEELRLRLATASQVVKSGGAAETSEGAVEVRPMRAGDEVGFDRVDPGSARTAYTTVVTPEGSTTLMARASTRPVREATETATRALLVGTPILLAIVAALTWFSTGRALRPVEAIRTEFARLSAHNLRRRMPLPPGKDALARLAVTLNETLDRLDDSVRRQRQFVADASHELRSPLTALRTPLEVALAHPGRVDWPQLARGTLQDLDRLEQLVTDLLALAKTDAPTQREGVPVDLSALVDHVVRPRRSGALRWDVEMATGVVVKGHRAHLERLFINLLDNAERYAHGTIQVRLFSKDRQAHVEIADDGPGIPAESREHVFERFARLDDARERAQGGAGLGLALARGIAVLHGGSLELLDSTSGARLSARLPLADVE